MIITGQGWWYKSRWCLISRNGLFAASHHRAISKLLSKSAAINQTMVLLHIGQVSTIPDCPRWSFSTRPPPSPPPLPCSQCWWGFLSPSNLIAIRIPDWYKTCSPQPWKQSKPAMAYFWFLSKYSKLSLGGPEVLWPQVHAVWCNHDDLCMMK